MSKSKIMINYCINPGIDYYKHFGSLFSAYRFFIKYDKDFYFFVVYEDTENGLKRRDLTCNFRNIKKKEITLE